MSVAEIIELIRKLPREEQEKVFAFVKSLVEAEALREEPGVRYMDAGAPPKPGAKVTEEFKRTADEMFTTNAELFRKLAQ